QLFFFRRLVFDHGRAPQTLKVALGLGAELLLEHLIANFLHTRRIGFGLFLVANREHLHSLRRRFGRSQVTDTGAVENVAQLLRQLGGILRDLIAYRDVGQRAGKRNAVAAVLKARAQGVGVMFAGLVSGLGRTARHNENDGAHDVFVAHVVLFRGLVQLELRFDILVPDFKARSVAPAHQIGPGNLRPQTALERVGARTAARKNLGQPRRVDAHSGGDGGIRLFYFRIGNFDAVTLGFGHLQDFVDKAIEHFLARRHLFAAELDEFAPMFDIEYRNGLAIDERDDLLRAGPRRNGEHDRCGEHRGHKSLPAGTQRESRYQLLFSLDQGRRRPSFGDPSPRETHHYHLNAGFRTQMRVTSRPLGTTAQQIQSARRPAPESTLP